MKTYQDRHTCNTQNMNKLVNAGFLEKYYYRKIKAAPTIKLRELKDLVKEDLRIEVSINQCRRAKIKVNERMQGSYWDEYNQLWDYAEELRRSNKGSSIFVSVDWRQSMKNPHFKRLYVCLNMCGRGFLALCKNIIGLNGYFLKGPCREKLLFVVGEAGNNQMCYVAWAQ